MSIKSILGLGASKKVRYGIVALGDISQESLMPGVEHTGNSEITALITGDPEKAKQVGRQYDVPADAKFGYEQFDAFLRSGKADAIYLATPNWRHAEFAVPALRAGIHVLLEKPMEIGEAKCREIVDAQRESGAKLMIAYRLHFEPATLAAIEAIRAGKLGSIRTFASTFTQNVKPTNHRADNGPWAGPLLDMGPYPINAVRNLFESEPIEAFAFASRSEDAGLPMDFDHTLSVTLRFPGDRVAAFVISYVADAQDQFVVTGNRGSLTLSPAYGFGKAKEMTLTIEKKKTSQSFKPTDHFGGEVKYFSDCILDGRDPEPDGEEGLLDVRVIEAILISLETKKAMMLAPATRSRRIDTATPEKLSMVSPPTLVNTEGPSQ